MSKILVGIIGAIVVITGAYFIFSSDSSSTPEQNNIVENSTAKPEGKKMAFSEFIKGGDSYKCTVNQSVGGVDTQGTTYINKGMIRGEYASQVQNMNIKSTLIVRDGYTYTWSSMTPNMGFKSKVIADTSANKNTGTSGSYSFNAEQIGDYNCEAWSADQSMFTLPAGVTFTEIGA